MGRPEWITTQELARIREQHPHLEQDTLPDHHEGDDDE